MALTLKDSDASDVVFQLTGFNGMSQTAADVANTASFKRTLATKHTMPSGTTDGRHLISANVRRYDAVSGKWGSATVNLTVAHDSSAIILADDIEDILAIVINYFSKNVAAMPAGFNTEVLKFITGISPV